MGGGYVLDFSNRTFCEFMSDTLGVDPYDGRYDGAGGSKANRLRQIWEVEPNHIVGRLVAALLDYAQHIDGVGKAEAIQNARKISERLCQGSSVDDLTAIRPNTDDRDFDVLAKEIKAAIDKNQLEAGIDRLHILP